MYIERKMPFLLTLGIFLGLMLFGVQIAVAAFNALVNPPRPVRLYHVERTADLYRVEVLGRSLTMPAAGDQLVRRIAQGGEEALPGPVGPVLDRGRAVGEAVASHVRVAGDRAVDAWRQAAGLKQALLSKGEGPYLRFREGLTRWTSAMKERLEAVGEE